MNRVEKFSIILIALVVFMLGAWLVNFYKLANCDFESNYRCEIIHGVGIIPPLQAVTVWFDSDSPEGEQDE